MITRHTCTTPSRVSRWVRGCVNKRGGWEEIIRLNFDRQFFVFFGEHLIVGDLAGGLSVSGRALFCCWWDVYLDGPER